MKRQLLTLILAAACAVSAQAQVPTTWTADNGNGTFTNPLFYDEFSDPDILRVGDDYYLAGTTMHSVPGLVILPFLFYFKKYREIFTLPWTILFFAVLVATPWSYLIYKRDVGFWEYFFYVEHVARFTTGVGSDIRTKPFFFYFLILPGVSCRGRCTFLKA